MVLKPKSKLPYLRRSSSLAVLSGGFVGGAFNDYIGSEQQRIDAWYNRLCRIQRGNDPSGGSDQTTLDVQAYHPMPSNVHPDPTFHRESITDKLDCDKPMIRIESDMYSNVRY